MVLDGEEDEALVIRLEDRLVEVAGDGGVADEAIASSSLEFVNLGLLRLDGNGELVSEGGRLREVELVERGSSDFGRGFLNSGDHLGGENVR